MGYANMKSLSNSIFSTLGIVVVMLVFMWLGFDAGQRNMIDSCEKASFFHYHDKVFECLPYKKGVP